MTEQHAQSPSTPLARNGSSRTRLVVVGVTVAVAVIGAAILFTQVGKDEATTESVTSTLNVDGRPNGLAVGPDALWVALNEPVGEKARKLERLNLVSGEVEQSVPIDEGVLSFVKRAGTSLWVQAPADPLDAEPGGRLLEFDWATGEPRQTIAFDQPAFGFAVDGQSVWVVVGRNPARVVRYDTSTGEPVGKPIEISPSRVIDMTLGAGALWAPASEEGMLIRVDRDTRKVDKVKVGSFPVGVVVSDGAVWVANRESGTVSRVNPETMDVVDTIDVGMYPTWLESSSGSIWVSNQADGTVTRIDGGSATTVGSPIKIASPSDDAAAHVLAGSGDSIWVASATEETVSRIDASR